MELDYVYKDNFHGPSKNENLFLYLGPLAGAPYTQNTPSEEAGEGS